MKLKDYLPILDWGKTYNRGQFASDMVAAAIVTIMLIPQSLAYALLAGLPAEMGLYASILPLLAYAVFGTSSVLAVGPVAVVSLMTATAVSRIAAEGSSDYVTAAVLLALLSGGMLTLMGILRLGFIANFLSHPVVSGFITAAGLVIATSQLGGIFGVATEGYTIPDLAISLFRNIAFLNPWTLFVGAGSLALLFWMRTGLKGRLVALGMPFEAARFLARAGPAIVVLLGIIATIVFDLGDRGVALVGQVPRGFPVLSLPSLNMGFVQALALPAFIISIVGFVESASVAQTLAAKRREQINPDRELVGLGAANIVSAAAGGFAVTGGLARSAVNHDAGAATPAAGAFTALGIAAASLLLTPMLAALPTATLSATIIVAVLSLVDLGIFKRAWRYSRTDFAAVAITFGGTLVVGVELGIALGVAASILIFLYRSSKPHAAIVGRIPGTEHYRNVARHEVEISSGILTIRVDESLYFANARYMENLVFAAVAQTTDVRHLILMCSAVNDIDLSALESLEQINNRLKDLGVRLHLSEVKGPVMDKLDRTDFIEKMMGDVFLTQHSAVLAISAADVAGAERYLCGGADQPRS